MALMTEFVIFLVDLALLVIAGGLAIRLGANPDGRLAAGLYAVVIGAGLLLVPLLGWEVARTDNAFLGLYLIALLAVALGAGLAIAALLALRRGASSGQALAVSAGVGVVAAALALVWLTVRGPGAWATGSGQFGLDVVVVAVVLGVAAHVVATRLAGDRP
jgi:hypothetical protein